MGRYIHYTDEQKRQANGVDLEQFLIGQGEKLLKAGREKRLASNHSVTINGNTWYDHATEKGGLAITFVRYFYQLSFNAAMAMLLDNHVLSAPPKRAERLFAHLIKRRHIDQAVLSHFVKKKLIYESAEPSRSGEGVYHNIIFVGYDETGSARHAHKCGLYAQGKPYRGNLTGSRPEYSFHYQGVTEKLYVFESPIDLLSFISLYKDRQWQQHHYVALCGLSDKPLFKMLENNKAIRRVFLCLDHDKAGMQASERIMSALSDKSLSVRVLRSTYKDWNEDIKALYNEYAIPAAGRNELSDQISTRAHTFCDMASGLSL